METPNGQLKRGILEQLRKSPMTMADLQARTPFSLPTLRRAVYELVDLEWITTLGQTPSTGGRPATLFGLNGQSHIIIGAHVEIPTVNMVAAQLDGKVVFESYIDSHDALTPDHAVEAVAQFTHQVQEAFPECGILGAGIAAPGYVDTQTGDILYVGRAEGWENYPMRTRLEYALKRPVIMENDTDCTIRVELNDGSVPDSSSVIYLAVFEGVKMSIMLNGQLYRGPFNNAGLIGRSKLPPDAPGVSFEAYYDLEETCSASGLCTSFENRVQAAGITDSTIQAIHDIENRNDRFQAILRHADEGHPLCIETVNKMIDDLSWMVSNLIFVLQPNILFMGGLLSNMPENLKVRLEREIRSKLPSLLSNYLIINFAAVTGRYAAAFGATQWFLDWFITTENRFEQRTVYDKH